MKIPTIKTGDDLRTFREALGLTQVEFAKLLGYSKDHISKMECGRERERINKNIVNACTLLAMTYKPKRKR